MDETVGYRDRPDLSPVARSIFGPLSTRSYRESDFEKHKSRDLCFSRSDDSRNERVESGPKIDPATLPQLPFMVAEDAPCIGLA